jgi:hypothetical protein
MTTIIWTLTFCVYYVAGLFYAIRFLKQTSLLKPSDIFLILCMGFITPITMLYYYTEKMFKKPFGKKILHYINTKV